MSYRGNTFRTTTGNHERPAKMNNVTESTAEGIQDDELAVTAVGAIQILTTVPSEKLQVTAHDGWLCLKGTLTWRHQRKTVEDVTRHLPGVRGLTDVIEVEDER
jgi:osmotically-inducible protein OsmY